MCNINIRYIVQILLYIIIIFNNKNADRLNNPDNSLITYSKY